MTKVLLQPYEGIGGFRFRLNDFNLRNRTPLYSLHTEKSPNELEERMFDTQGPQPCHP